MDTFYQMWGISTPEAALAVIEEQKIRSYQEDEMRWVIEPRNLENRHKY